MTTLGSYGCTTEVSPHSVVFHSNSECSKCAENEKLIHKLQFQLNSTTKDLEEYKAMVKCLIERSRS